jgi:adenosine deaminase
MIMAGFKSSFLPFHERQEYLRRVGQELSRYDDEGNPLTSPTFAQVPSTMSDRNEWTHVPTSASVKN